MILPKTTLSLLCVALSAMLALATSAVAAPAGDEYLPKVPASANPGGASGSHQDLSEPQASGTDETTPTTGFGTSGSGSGSGSDSASASDSGSDAKQEKQQGAGKKPTKIDVKPSAGISSGGSDGGNSSGLLIVLLIIAGVVAAAVGMILRHRAGAGEDDGGEGKSRERQGPQASGARPTPDGEIVTGRDNV